MPSRLINVRLDDARVRKARALRARGIVLSDLVREAIDACFEEVSKARERRDVSAIVARVFDDYPDPPDLPPRTYRVRDRMAARDAILKRLRRKRR
jgi:hypothetical protein